MRLLAKRGSLACMPSRRAGFRLALSIRRPGEFPRAARTGGDGAPRFVRIALVGGQPHIAREREKRRAGAPGLRGTECLAEEFPQLLGCGDFRGVFGNRTHQGDGVEGLVGGFDPLVEGNLAADGENRITFCGGGSQSGGQVPDTGTGCCHHHAGSTGHPPYRGSHERGILLMTAKDELNLFRGSNRFKHTIDLGSGNSKNMGDTMIFQHTDENLRAGGREGHVIID